MPLAETLAAVDEEEPHPSHIESTPGILSAMNSTQYIRPAAPITQGLWMASSSPGKSA